MWNSSEIVSMLHLKKIIANSVLQHTNNMNDILKITNRPFVLITLMQDITWHYMEPYRKCYLS